MIVIVVQRQLMISPGGPEGSPGKSSDAPPTVNGSFSATVCPSAALCVGRVRASSAACHRREKALPLPKALAARRRVAAFTVLRAPWLSVRAMTRARGSVTPAASRTREAILGISSPSARPCAMAARALNHSSLPIPTSRFFACARYCCVSSGSFRAGKLPITAPNERETSSPALSIDTVSAGSSVSSTYVFHSAVIRSTAEPDNVAMLLSAICRAISAAIKASPAATSASYSSAAASSSSIDCGSSSAMAHPGKQTPRVCSDVFRRWIADHGFLRLRKVRVPGVDGFTRDDRFGHLVQATLQFDDPV